MDLGFTGRNVLITGGTSGIGLAAAGLFAPLEQSRHLATPIPGPRSRELMARKARAVSAGGGTTLPVFALTHALRVWPVHGSWVSLRVERVQDPLFERSAALLVTESPWQAAYGLSARELDALNGLAQGASNQRIASERSISVRTVTTHVERISVKLGLDPQIHCGSDLESS